VCRECRKRTAVGWDSPPSQEEGGEEDAFCRRCGAALQSGDQFCGQCGARRGEARPQPAGFWIRVLAAICDVLVLLPLSVGVLLNLAMWQSLLVALLIQITAILYKPLMEGLRGATLGKQLCGIRVRKETGENIAVGDALVRNAIPLLLGGLALVECVLEYTSPLPDRAHLAIPELIRRREPVHLLRDLVGIFALIDCLFVAFTAKKTALHDLWSGTRCVYREKA
jgi:uncharacterized RDD family membrane protein YckC